MKIVQIINNMVFYVLEERTLIEAANHHNINELKEKHGVTILEAPDNVKQQWVYDEHTGTFSPPTPPDGWGYDEETGVFFELNPPASFEQADAEKVLMAEFIISLED